MITTIGAIEFLAVMVLAEIDTDSKVSKKKVLKWTYPELREKADLLEDVFPSIRIDLRRASLEDFQFIENLDVVVGMPNISIHTNNKTKEIMELYRPSSYIYQQFRDAIAQ